MQDYLVIALTAAWAAAAAGCITWQTREYLRGRKADAIIRRVMGG
ncbi:MAG: hypothetical protein ACRECN_00410 [Methylocella sp.]